MSRIRQFVSIGAATIGILAIGATPAMATPARPWHGNHFGQVRHIERTTGDYCVYAYALHEVVCIESTPPATHKYF